MHAWTVCCDMILKWYSVSYITVQYCTKYVACSHLSHNVQHSPSIFDLIFVLQWQLVNVAETNHKTLLGCTLVPSAHWLPIPASGQWEPGPQGRLHTSYPAHTHCRGTDRSHWQKRCCHQWEGPVAAVAQNGQKLLYNPQEILKWYWYTMSTHDQEAHFFCLFADHAATVDVTVELS